MKNKSHLICCILLTCLALAVGVNGTGPATALAAPAAPDSYPPDPTADIPWSAGASGVADIQTAFNNARTQENAQLGIHIPLMYLPKQSIWNTMDKNQRALWLINRERIDRGVHPLQGAEDNVTSVAQAYAEYLLANDAYGHEADGRTPSERMKANPAINACNDGYFTEDLSIIGSSADNIELPVERAIYAWLYIDSGVSWGHRHSVLRYPYNDNSGPLGREGLLGIGQASGGPYQGPFPMQMPFAEIIIMDLFDPCSSWTYPPEYLYLPVVGK